MGQGILPTSKVVSSSEAQALHRLATSTTDNAYGWGMPRHAYGYGIGTFGPRG